MSTKANEDNRELEDWMNQFSSYEEMINLGCKESMRKIFAPDDAEFVRQMALKNNMVYCFKSRWYGW